MFVPLYPQSYIIYVPYLFLFLPKEKHSWKYQNLIQVCEMAKWIHLAALFFVGAALCCRDEERRKLYGHCRSALCIKGNWYLHQCVPGIMNDIKNTPERKLDCGEGTLYLDHEEPRIYYQCHNGTLFPKRCPDGQEFSYETNTCLETSSKVPDRNSHSRSERSVSELEMKRAGDNVGSMCDEDTTYSDVFDVTAYYKCIGGKLISYICQGDAIFNSEKQRCVSPSSRPKVVANSFITKQARCNHGETRKKEGSCKQFYECVNGTEVIGVCMDCQNYDEHQKKCRYVFDYPCQLPGQPTTSPSEGSSTGGPGLWTSDPSPSDTTEVIDTSTRIASDGGSSPNPTAAGNEVSTTVTTTVKVPSTSSEPESSALPFGDCKHRRALPDCKYYLECHEGELVTRRCGWLQYFDSLSNSCSFMGYKCHETK
ncbi:unnamed protein product [Nezara viridula]|uniref:Chitin-binding type-2 domain-containing protein n=1 Tax=Nezara viridula TaxID=85310 RepID=A0A9P0MM28_NEZVI|nr:unnamed protein product [Nezara viridula]